MIHMTNQTMQWIIDKKDDVRGGRGVGTSYEGMQSVCGVQIEGWINAKYDKPDKHYATAIAYSTSLAKQYKVGLNQYFGGYGKVNCPKCIKILKNNGL